MCALYTCACSCIGDFVYLCIYVDAVLGRDGRGQGVVVNLHACNLFIFIYICLNECVIAFGTEQRSRTSVKITNNATLYYDKWTCSRLPSEMCRPARNKLTLEKCGFVVCKVLF